jgi:predicted RNA-binding protein associated with RNAse of E/G family
MPQHKSIIIVKNDHTGKEMIQYEARVLQRKGGEVVVEAMYTHDDRDLGYVVFRRGDRFVERHYSDRWYNIFEVYDPDGHIKGWYCNFTRPATIRDGRVESDDLALDLWVGPDGKKQVLDQEDFDALTLTKGERAAVLAALEELKARSWPE